MFSVYITIKLCSCRLLLWQLLKDQFSCWSLASRDHLFTPLNQLTVWDNCVPQLNWLFGYLAIVGSLILRLARPLLHFIYIELFMCMPIYRHYTQNYWLVPMIAAEVNFIGIYSSRFSTYCIERHDYLVTFILLWHMFIS